MPVNVRLGRASRVVKWEQAKSKPIRDWQDANLLLNLGGKASVAANGCSLLRLLQLDKAMFSSKWREGFTIGAHHIRLRLSTRKFLRHAVSDLVHLIHNCVTVTVVVRNCCQTFGFCLRLCRSLLWRRTRDNHIGDS